jgi:hypothetical protein
VSLPSPVGWLFDVLGVKDIFDALNNAYPRRQQMRFLGNASLADNPTLGATDITIGSGQMYRWSAVSAPAAAGARFPVVIDGSAPSSTEAAGQLVVTAPLTAGYFSFVCGNTALSVDSVVCTVRKNGVDTALTFTIPASTAPGTVISDSAHTVTFARGDKVSVKMVQSGINPQTNWFGLFQLA